MKIRIGTKQDIPKLREILKSLWFMHADEEPDFINRKVIEESDLSRYLKDFFDSGENDFLFVAEEETKMVGVMKLTIQPIQNFFNEVKVLYVDDIYIAEGFRGKGLAKNFLVEAEKIAKEKKIKWLKARIYTFNTVSQGLFTSAGYKNLYSEYFKIIKD